MVDDIKLAEVLVLDDIGAEQSTPWVRDEILQVILQYRMQEDLPTFFTSNFNFQDLENILPKERMGMMKLGKLDGSWNGFVIWQRRQD